MAKVKTRSIALIFGLLLVVTVVGALVLAFIVSRDVPFDWENPNYIEAAEARRKLKLFESSMESHQRGFVRLSQLEINSYLMSVLNPTNKTTNSVQAEMNTDASRQVKLRRAAVLLTSTNMILHSWGDGKMFGVPVKFVVQRGLRFRQEGSEPWTMNTEFLKVGEMEIAPKNWPRLQPYLDALDKPLLDELKLSTNFPAVHIARSEVNRPEFRIYTYKPIPQDAR
jgi:hypothetical protein